MEDKQGTGDGDVLRARRIIADHMRTATFILCDPKGGVKPGNVGANYVLRRLIRRAVRYARQLGIAEGFTVKLAEVICDKYKHVYPELAQNLAQCRLDLEAEEVQEFRRIESEYERDVRDLRARIVAFIAKYQQDPQQLMATMLQGKVLLSTNPGHVLVNGDMKIVLPEYDEMEIKMPAMSRTIYILFMKHRMQSGNGIVLKNIDAYRNEIIDIYSMVKPGANEARVEESVNNLCNPLSDALNQAISRANRCIRNVVTDKELARQYMISGSRGEEYSIGLAPEYMTLPRAVTGN